MSEAWDKWSSESFSDENLNSKIITEPVKEIMKEFDGLNVSYKVESKEIPRLPAGKLLKGKIFNDWHTNFLAKISLAKINDILDKFFVRPDTNNKDYPIFKMKLDYFKNHLLTATVNSNASSFIKPKTMDSIEMYKKLVNVFHGQEHNEEIALKAATTFELLRFNRQS